MPNADDELLHGFLVLHAHTGSLLYSQRFTAGYGLADRCPAACDEMRFSAMLFALSLRSRPRLGRFCWRGGALFVRCGLCARTLSVG